MCIRDRYPVLAKLWMFWGNFFAISDKDMLAYYSTGPYQREIIRPNLNKTFEKMVYDVTTSWAMIHHLDNSESAGPKSKTARAEWRRKKKKPATINENHARELLELHTVSPKAGYSQEDVIQLAYIMTGWQHKYSKKNLETGNIWFNSEYHQWGKKKVLGRGLDALLGQSDDENLLETKIIGIFWRKSVHCVSLLTIPIVSLNILLKKLVKSYIAGNHNVVSSGEAP